MKELHEINVSLKEKGSLPAGVDKYRRAELVRFLGANGDVNMVEVLNECLTVGRYESENARYDLPIEVMAIVAKFNGLDNNVNYWTERIIAFLDRFGAEKGNAYEVTDAVTEAVKTLGGGTTTVLRGWLAKNLNRQGGRAAIIGVEKLPPELALPVVEDALKSSNLAVRHHSAAYLIAHQNSSECKVTATKYLSAETDAAIRHMLQATLR